MKLTDHLPKFACKQLKHDLGITTVEEALTYSDDELKRSKGVGNMFCYHLRQLETKCRDQHSGPNTIMENESAKPTWEKLPCDFQVGEEVGLESLIDMLHKAKNGKVTKVGFSNGVVKYDVQIDIVEALKEGETVNWEWHFRLANLNGYLLNKPFDNGFHYNSLVARVARGEETNESKES